jgi:hypothetical protein
MNNGISHLTELTEMLYRGINLELISLAVAVLTQVCQVYVIMG